MWRFKSRHHVVPIAGRQMSNCRAQAGGPETSEEKPPWAWTESCGHVFSGHVSEHPALTLRKHFATCFLRTKGKRGTGRQCPIPEPAMFCFILTHQRGVSHGGEATARRPWGGDPELTGWCGREPARAQWAQGPRLGVRTWVSCRKGTEHFCYWGVTWLQVGHRVVLVPIRCPRSLA